MCIRDRDWKIFLWWMLNFLISFISISLSFFVYSSFWSKCYYEIKSFVIKSNNFIQCSRFKCRFIKTRKEFWLKFSDWNKILDSVYTRCIYYIYNILSTAATCIYNIGPNSWMYTVSYTHLDVYKRQPIKGEMTNIILYYL